MEHTSPSMSPRPRAISGRRLSLAHEFLEVASFSSPLPVSKQSDKKPDFSGFSWKQPHLTSPELCFSAPMSPRKTVFSGNHKADASDNASSTS
jgi:hypothetical protein